MALVTVRFYGAIARHGNRFDVHAETAKEAINMIVSQLDDLKQEFVDRFFHLRVAKRDVTEKELPYYEIRKLRNGDVVHVVPKAHGASGAMNFIAGAALIAFSLSNPFGWAALAIGSTTVGAVAFGVGISLIAGGVANLLVKQPKMTTGGSQDDSKNYSFNNLANVTQQGAAIPLCYGKITIGAHVISQGVASYRINKESDGGDIEYEKIKIPMVRAKDPNGVTYNTPDNDRTYTLVEVE